MPRTRRARGPSGARLAEVGRALDEVRARCDVAARRATDPIEFVHAYASPEDREIVALVASSFAFGNVKALRAKIADALDRLGPRPARTADDASLLRRRLAGFRHRVYRDGDVVALVLGARAVQRQHGSLGRALREELDAAGGDLREAASRWVEAIRSAGGLDRRGNRGASHILASPAGGSASKRLMLLFRWMARPADGVDLGLWDVPTSRLVIPVDTHIHKLARNLDLTTSKTASWRAAVEITGALAKLDPEDPVKYDFALCHMGMVQRCPSRRDARRCEGCGVLPTCRHWRRDRARAGA
jgi:uncharacterized protein (TIGR02757 family)